MAGRVTRSHRRTIEKKTQQKIDLNDLAKIEPEQLVSNVEDVPSIEESNDQELQAQEESTAANSDDENEDTSEDDSSEEENDSSDSSEDEDEDLDALLEKAKEALASQTASIQLENDASDKINTKLSKMDSGITVEKELYFKNVAGRSKLIPDAVALVDDGEKASAKATVVLKPSKDEKQLTKKERQAEREKTSGSAWFDMPKTEMTDEVKRDLQVLKMRHILDRKRHYKKMGKRPDPKYFQIGTIIESPTEFFSARINKKDRKQTIVDELMASDELKQYYKRKHSEVQERTNSGGKKHYKKLKAQRQWAK
ncbi:hypothetical protein HMPREF1544_04540 [Mucor circinelloides 1006PhL]|uniref:Fcf2 pre-rRNA processing C-terminal domain-containing protein n=1 Tax=Mucor circinelloides f. circinelloides (strain 1006PhL) TaxID=1220926 RepID=S2K0I3_MUCC1|nr:hypothetical protein HMPREF1544_04540 [Mucor circinelloides 1006PhL]KAG1081170.1 hypothetical protein G6F42_023045 [Rhizopus arrhizus]